MRRIDNLFVVLMLCTCSVGGGIPVGYAAEEPAAVGQGSNVDGTPKAEDAAKAAQATKTLPPGVKKFAFQEKLFTVEVEEASVPDIMRLLSEASGVQIEVMEGVKGKATARINGADLENTVRQVLQAAGEANWAREYTHFEGTEGGDRLTRIAVLPKAERKEVRTFAEGEYQPPPFPNELGYEAIEVPVRNATYVAFKGVNGEISKVIDISDRSDKHEIRSVEDIQKLDQIFLDAVEKELLTKVIGKTPYPILFEKRSGSGQNPVVSTDGNFVVVGEYESHYASIIDPAAERNIIGDGAIAEKRLTTIYDASGSEVIQFKELTSDFAPIHSSEPDDFAGIFHTGISSTGKYLYFIPYQGIDEKSYLIYDVSGKKVIKLKGSSNTVVKFSYDDNYMIVFYESTKEESWIVSIYALGTGTGTSYVKTEGVLFVDDTFKPGVYNVATVNEPERTMIVYKKARYGQKEKAMELSY